MDIRRTKLGIKYNTHFNHLMGNVSIMVRDERNNVIISFYHTHKIDHDNYEIEINKAVDKILGSGNLSI